jgi:poly-gamma-glutamate synthase PgsB/CapB
VKHRVVTEDELLAALPPFERATGRRAVQAIVEAMRRGLTLRGVAKEAAARLAAERRRLVDAPDARDRELSLKEIGRREAEVRCALHGASRLAGSAATPHEPLIELAIELAADPSWRVVAAAFEVLRAETALARRAPDGARDLAWTLVESPATAVWSQVAAWRFLFDAASSEADQREQAKVARAAAGRLERRREPEADDLFVRARVARILAGASAEIAVPALIATLGDPSEHVRMSAVAALGDLGAADALLVFASPTVEASPRVRAAAAAAVGPLRGGALERTLLRDPSEIPCRAALDEAERLAAADHHLRSAISNVAASAPWPQVRALAADAAERIHHQVDHDAARVLEALRAAAAVIPVGQWRDLTVDADAARVGRALAVLASDDFGLTAQYLGGAAWRLTRGEPEERRLWRLLHELRHPSPDKRQGRRHTVGRAARGELRAPTGLLAEISPTRVPGERVFIPEVASWGRHLPAVNDLLDLPAGGELRIYSSFGVSTLRFPARKAWPRVRARLTLRYAELARIRQQALRGADGAERGMFYRALVELGFELRFEPHRTPAAADVVELYSGRAEASASPASGQLALVAPLPAGGLLERLTDLLSFDLSGLHTANQVAAVGAVALGLMAARLVEARQEIDRARACIPLSIGGWGTRGKSGTERLKAALFQALGCEVFVKTTGCEAMFLHAIPGQRAEEIFLYRTYDKATIWEQRDTLRLASRLGVDVFLWECMALNPDYVDILERRWMRDDLCTLTNAYPDHENIQGPTGLDVAQVMTAFIPPGRPFVTAEQQMLPVLREAARARGARLLQVDWKDVDLLPEDVLARFPYREHPRNIALVLALAAELGVERDVALKEMADWIVPDLGVLKVYPAAEWKGRRLEFANGMSANERTGFLGNWTRLGFHEVDGDTPATSVVTVINNRGDRSARSVVFADIVARDIGAHRHVIIGTNVRGFARGTVESFRRWLSEEHLVPGRVLARLQLGELGPARLAREAAYMAAGLRALAPVASAATFARVFELEDADVATAPELERLRARVATVLGPELAGYSEALGEAGADAVGHLVDLATKHVAVTRWQARSDEPDAERRFRVLAVALFRSSLVVVDDAAATGDQVIDIVARAAPPGFRTRVLGAQNIKGTGLDFAYRWVALEGTRRSVEALEDPDPTSRLAAARTLLSRTDLGILDCEMTLAPLRHAASRAPDDESKEWQSLVSRLETRAEEARRGLAGRARRRPILGAIERVIDVWDGVLRKHRAGRVVDDLVKGRRSHGDAAAAVRELVARQKGGWLGG